MVSRSVSVLALIALTALTMSTTTVRAQDSVLPRGAAHLLDQVLEVVHAVKATRASPHHADAHAETSDADANATGEAHEAEEVEATHAAAGGVIPYARTVVQLLGRGVPLDDTSGGATTLNIRPHRGGCVFRLRVGF